MGCAFVQMQLVNERVIKYTPVKTHCICAKLQPFQLLCRHTSNLQHITYILQGFGPLAGLRAYAHYISPCIVHPSLTHCISAKVSSSSTHRHTYSMQHIIYILQSFGPLAGPRAYAHYIRPHKAHPSLTNCISAKVQPFQLLYRHTYNMQQLSISCKALVLRLVRAYAHYIGSHIVHPSLTGGCFSQGSHGPDCSGPATKFKLRIKNVFLK